MSSEVIKEGTETELPFSYIGLKETNLGGNKGPKAAQ